MIDETGRSTRFLATCACAGLLAVASAPAGARTLAEIRATGELRICVAGSSASFYQANGEAFARFLAVRPLVTQLAHWDQQFQNEAGGGKDGRNEARLLANGSCDLFPNDLHITDSRRAAMQLVPYYTTRKVIVAHRKLRPILRQPANLAGRTAMVQKGTAYEAWLTRQNESAYSAEPVVIQFLPTADSMKAVSEGRADFTVIGAEGAFKWVRGELENLDLLFPVDDQVAVGWGISLSANDLRAELERFFAENLRVGSDIDRAWQKQYGISRMEYQLFEASFGSKGADLKAILAWFVPLGSGLLGLTLAMLFWGRRLRREIAEHRRTEAALRASQTLVTQESARRLAITQIQLHLQQVQSLEDFGRTLLSDLARQIPVAQALFCIWDRTRGSLRAVAHYAGSGVTPSASLADFRTAGGLIDQCVAMREPILIKSPEPDYPLIHSGLGNCVPAALLIYPICQLDRIHAVLELATFQVIDNDHRQLLDDLQPFIAWALDRLNAQISR